MFENTPRKETEKQLAAALQAGDQRALAQLYDRYAPVLLGLISRILKDAEAAEAILQRTFLMIWEKRKTYQETNRGLLTWMIMLAKEAALERSNAGNPLHVQENRNFAGKEAGELTSSENELPLQQAYCNLQPQEKAVLDLVYLKGYSCQEAAAALGIPVETLVMNLKMAVKHIGAETAS